MKIPRKMEKPRIRFIKNFPGGFLIVIKLTKNKTLEIQGTFYHNFDFMRFGLELEFRLKMDHPGFDFSLHFFPVELLIQFYDNRHLEDF